MSSDIPQNNSAEPDGKVPSQIGFGQKLRNLRQAIFNRRPILQDIIVKHGWKSLYDYGQDYLDVNINPTILERQNEFLQTFKCEVEKLLGESVAESAVKQLQKYYFVSTADHHGPITHPFFLNSNLIISSAYAGHSDESLKNIICLSCANVSLNNSSFPRGLLFQTHKNGQTKINRLSFLPANAHSATVYGFRPYSEGEIKKLKQLINDLLKKREIDNQQALRLSLLLDEIYSSPQVFDLNSYSDQVTVTNYQLWKRFFHGADHPNLIYLEQESLVAKLLVEHHLDKNTAISRILFEPGVMDLVEKYFEGIMGTFSREQGWGTYFFWGVTHEKNYRLSLWRKENQLISKDGQFILNLNKEEIRKALEEKRIIPSLLTTFMVLSLYYGLKCLGGFNQVNYLTKMKEAFIKLHHELGDNFSAEVCEQVQTKEFVDGPTITFGGTPDGNIVPSTGLDLVLYGGRDFWDRLIARAKDITLGEAFDPLLPELYQVIYAEVDRDPELTSIVSAQITKHNGLAQKIKPMVDIY